MKNNYSTKRIFAYFLDILIIAFISSLITRFLPSSDKSIQLSNETVEVLEKYTNKEITIDEYTDTISNISYELNKETFVISIVTIVLSTFYYVIAVYYMDGQTLGKKILKIRIVSNDKKKLTMNNYLLRAFLINSLLMNTITTVTILFLNKSLYFQVTNIVSYIFQAIMVVSLTMMMFRKDGRGLHDILANTKVISVNNKAIPEATIIKEDEHEEVKVDQEKIIDAEICEKK